MSTNSIRGGKSRAVLDRIVQTTRIFEAWSDEPWVNEGAAVRVSLVAFGRASQPAVLDGRGVSEIYADLATAAAGENAVDLTRVSLMTANSGCCFIGGMKKGKFDIPGNLAREWLTKPNPNQRSNAEVVRPWFNGLDITRRPGDKWIIDFGVDKGLTEASLYEQPFAYVSAVVKPTRDAVRNDLERQRWWLHARPAPDLREAVEGLGEWIATPRNGRHRLFAKVSAAVVPDGQLAVIAREDDTTLGILQSRLHEVWSLRMCTWLGVGNDPRYTPTTCFETFPFPEGLEPQQTSDRTVVVLDDGASVPSCVVGGSHAAKAAAIATAAKRLMDLREEWLNPTECTERVPEVVPLGMAESPYPDRILARPGYEKELASRTLTNLYNQRPPWLDAAHKALDQAVAAAYGWTDYSPAMSDETILSRLLALNLARSRGAMPAATPLAMAA